MNASSKCMSQCLQSPPIAAPDAHAIAAPHAIICQYLHTNINVCIFGNVYIHTCAYVLYVCRIGSRNRSDSCIHLCVCRQSRRALRDRFTHTLKMCATIWCAAYLDVASLHILMSICTAHTPHTPHAQSTYLAETKSHIHLWVYVHLCVHISFVCPYLRTLTCVSGTIGIELSRNTPTH